MTALQTQNDPAAIAVAPGHGSQHPPKDIEMNKATNTTASAIEQGNICDKVDRLARELSEALPQWANGSFMAMVYPDGDARGYWFRNVNVYDRKGQTDPITDAIQAYRDGEKAFSAIDEDDWEAHGGHEAVIAKTYGPALNAVDTWNQAAVTKLGAMAALRFALEEAEDFWCEPSVKAMMRAALGYLEGAAA